MLGLSSAQMQAIAREMNLSEFENRERIAHALGLNADALLDGIAEDPATGSASGPLTMLLRKANLIAGGDPIEAVSEQGTKMPGAASSRCARMQTAESKSAGGPCRL